MDPLDMPPWEIAARVCGAAALLGLSALFAGMTLGVMGMDTSSLEIVMESGNLVDRARARRIMTVRRDGNLLLVTLLLGNVAVNSLISILTAELTSGYAGFAISTILITLLGEIIPQASCSRHGLRLGSVFVPLVRLFIVIFYPLSKPVALALDYFLGDEVGTYFTRTELTTMVRMHVTRNMLEPVEADIMRGALSFSHTRVKDVATPLSRVFAVFADDRVDEELVSRVFRSGFSRIPVWADRSRVTVAGVLYTKDLLLVSTAARVPVIAVVHFFSRQTVNIVDEDDTLLQLMRTFTASRKHIAIVRAVQSRGDLDPIYAVSGIVTQENLLEAILGQGIHDEHEHPGSKRGGGEGAGGDSEGDHSEGAHDPDRDARSAAVAAALHSSCAFFIASSPPAAAPLAAGSDSAPAAVAGRLSSGEARAVAGFLALCFGLSPGAASWLATTSDVLVFVGLSPRNAASQAPAGLRLPPEAGFTRASLESGTDLRAAKLLQRGLCVDACLLILQGTVRCSCGNGEFVADKGAWDLLAERALRDDNYTPDFDAIAVSPIVRCLRIARTSLQAAQRNGGAPESADGAAAEGVPEPSDQIALLVQ